MSKRKLIISTGNKNKVEEIRDILKGLNIEVLSKTDIDLGDLDVIEDGDTLEENSIKKARALAEKVDFMVIADDSGLFVDELNGEPGVYSSRYAGEEGNDSLNNKKLLEKLQGITLDNRKGKFLTVIALITEDKKVFTVEGECKGTIGFELKGEGGFGYDPLFIPDGYTETFAEVGHDIKNKISHRAKALSNLRDTLITILKDDKDENSCS